MKPLLGQVKLFHAHRSFTREKRQEPQRGPKQSIYGQIITFNPKTILWLWIELTSSFPPLRDSAWASSPIPKKNNVQKLPYFSFFLKKNLSPPKKENPPIASRLLSLSQNFFFFRQPWTCSHIHRLARRRPNHHHGDDQFPQPRVSSSSPLEVVPT